MKVRRHEANFKALSKNKVKLEFHIPQKYFKIKMK